MYIIMDCIAEIVALYIPVKQQIMSLMHVSVLAAVVGLTSECSAPTHHEPQSLRVPELEEPLQASAHTCACCVASNLY